MADEDFDAASIVNEALPPSPSFAPSIDEPDSPLATEADPNVASLCSDADIESIPPPVVPITNTVVESFNSAALSVSALETPNSPTSITDSVSTRTSIVSTKASVLSARTSIISEVNTDTVTTTISEPIISDTTANVDTETNTDTATTTTNTLLNTTLNTNAPTVTSAPLTPLLASREEEEEPKCWRPLLRLLHGIAVFPFTPSAYTQYTLLEPSINDTNTNTDGRVIPPIGELTQPILLPNPHTNHPGAVYQLPLEAGDHIFAFERNGEWIRGYVIAPFPLQTTPRMGIFPLSHVALRDSYDPAAHTWQPINPDNMNDLTKGVLTPEGIQNPIESLFNQAAASVSRPGTGHEVAAYPLPDISNEYTMQRSTSFRNTPTKPKKLHKARSMSFQATSIRPNHVALPAVPAIPRDVSVMGRREPLVDAMAQVLREWCSLLHTYLRQQRYSLFALLRDLMFEVLHGRRQLIAQALPQDGLHRLRQHLVQLVAYGNNLQGLDQTARESDGDVVGQLGQVVALYREHLRLTCCNLRPKSINLINSSATASGGNNNGNPSGEALLSPTGNASHSGHGSNSNQLSTVAARGPAVKATRRTTAWDMPVESQTFYHLSLDLNAFVASVCSAGEHVELYFWIYDYRGDRQLTECYLCELTENGVAADHDKIGRLRTVFLELTERELTEEDLYLVCRVVRRGHMMLGAGDSSKDSGGGGILGGAVSVGKHHGRKVSSNLVDTNTQDPKSMPDIRRPIGVAVLPLRDALRGQDITAMADRGELEVGEHIMSIYVPTAELGFAELHRALIARQTSDYTRTPKAEAVCISMRLFRGDTNAVFRAHPNWLLDASRSLRLGFPDVVVPGMSRNHLYIRLVGGEFTQGLKRQVRSVECRVEVRSNADGRVLSGVLARASGDVPTTTAFNSLVLHHCNAPVWEEAFRLDIPKGQFEDAHLFFSFRHVNTSASSNSGGIIGGSGGGNNNNSGGIIGGGNSGASADINDEKQFAFGVLPLVGGDGCALKDGERQLSLFRWDARIVRPVVYLRCLIAPVVSGEGALVLSVNESATDSLGMPNGVVTLDAPLGSPTMGGLTASTTSSPAAAAAGPKPQPLKDTFVVRSLLCSTHYSQAPALINLLRWKTLVRNRRSDLTTILHQFAFVDEMEVVKFLQDVFDALCEILGCTWYRDLHAADSARQVSTQTVTAIIRVLGIVNDRRFNNFQPVVSVYLARHMRSEQAWRDLLGTLRRFVDDPCNPEHAVTFRSALKVWSELIGFAMRSRAIQRINELERQVSHTEQSHHEEEFLSELRGLFAELTRLMRVTEPQSVIGAQTIAARSVHRAFGPELMGCLGAEEVAQLAVEFIDAVGRRSFATGGLRLRAVGELLEGPLMDHGRARPIITKAVVRWLSETLESPPTSADSKQLKWRETARTALTILVRLADRLRDALRNRRTRPLTTDGFLTAKLAAKTEFGQTTASINGYADIETASLGDAITAVLTILPKLTVLFEQLVNMEIPSVAKVSMVNVFDETLSDIAGESEVDLATVPSSVLSGVGELATAALAVFELPTSDQLLGYLRGMLHIEGEEPTVVFLMRLFEMLEAMLTETVFPKNWFNASVVVCRNSMTILQPIALLLMDAFVPPPLNADKFRQPLWGAFFRVLLRLLSCPQLQLDHLTAQQRMVADCLAGDDMRVLGAQLLRETWSSIGWEHSGQRTGGYQVRFTQRFLGPVLSLGLSTSRVLRECACNVLFSICYSEHAIYGNLKRTEVECMDTLDKLAVWQRPGAEETRQWLIADLRQQFVSAQVSNYLMQQAEEFLGNVSRFLELLFHVRSCLMVTSLKMNVLLNIDQDEIYVKYVHQLVGVQARNQNLVEAGLTLKLHADLLEWSLTKRVDAIAALQLPAQSAFERKEQLYLQVLEYFTAGQAWELAIELCRELAYHYEHTVFDYPRLSDMLRQQAALHEDIVNKERYFSEYFRVGFYGKTFPSGLRNKQYIYRGLEWEKIGAFCERIQNKYPAARLLKSSAPPDERIINGDLQYVQITSVHPEPDRTRPVFAKGDLVPAAIRAYYEHNDVMTFSFSRPFKREAVVAMPPISLAATPTSLAMMAAIAELDSPLGIDALPSESQVATSETQTSNEFLELWTEKTVLITEHPFPSMLRRAEVVSTSLTELSPIENAVVAMRAKNRELLALEKRYLVFVGSGRVSCNPFTMSLNGAVNAPVNGGVKLYKQAFLKNEMYLRANTDKTSHIRELDDAVVEQAEIISRCLDIHGRIVPQEMVPLHENLLQFFRINFAEEIERLQNKRVLCYVPPPSPAPLSPAVAAATAAAAAAGGSGGVETNSDAGTSTPTLPLSMSNSANENGSTSSRIATAWKRLSTSSTGSRESADQPQTLPEKPPPPVAAPARKPSTRRWTIRRKKTQASV
ncbi:hypothetical protein BDF19DRAFT_415419 [Syncephalis fuscata]|nr:hypothetical protein BDF19DRAFT_415419 [Syncephalis fuscata]